MSQSTDNAIGELGIIMNKTYTYIKKRMSELWEMSAELNNVSQRIVCYIAISGGEGFCNITLVGGEGFHYSCCILICERL